MELRQLRYFAAVARHRHFTRAAEELHVAQPALSQQIRRLEEELGVALLVRTSRRVRLSDAGSAFLARAQRVLAEVDAARDEAAEFVAAERGRVVIGAMLSLGLVDLPALLAAFTAEHPQIDVAVVEDTTEAMIKRVERDELDVAFATLGEYPHAGLDVSELFREELVLITARDHPLARRRRVPLTAAAGDPFIFFKPGTGLRAAVDRATAAAGFEPAVRFETSDIARLRAFASHGLGVSIAPRSVTERPGDPVAVVTLSPPLERRVGLFWRSGREPAPAARAFRDFVLAELAG